MTSQPLVPRTALHWAALNGDASICSVLLAHRADPHPSWNSAIYCTMTQTYSAKVPGTFLEVGEGLKSSLFQSNCFGCDVGGPCFIRSLNISCPRPKVSDSLHRRRTRLLPEHVVCRIKNKNSNEHHPCVVKHTMF